MKNLKFFLIVVMVIVLSAAGVSTLSAAPEVDDLASTLVLQPSHVLEMSSSTMVGIMGSNYEPGQEVRLLVYHNDGSISDIGSQLDPEPVANEFGVWSTAWTIGRYSKSGICQMGTYVMKATDTDYNVLATVPFVYYSPKKEDYAEWPTAARACVKEPTE